MSLVPAVAAAQGQREDPAALASMRVGPFALTPTFALRDVGIDTNVLGQVESESDFTMTFAPGLDAWVRVGRLRLSSETEVEWLYFQKTATQRAFSITETGTVSMPLAYLTPYVTGTYENTKRRQSAELDVRIRQKTTGWAGGAVVYLGPRTDLDVRYRDERIRFGDVDGISGIPVVQVLDRDNQAVEMDVGYALTALTRVVARVVVEQDRFTESPLRDADSWSVLPGLEFKASALISGTAFVGYRKFETLNAAVPDFAGVIASVELKYVARDMTKIEGQASRNVEYSFEPQRPFFVQNEWLLSLTQALTYDWDVRAQVGRTDLDYQALDTALSNSPERLWLYGVGVGRRLGSELRLGMDVTYTRRQSEIPGRAYNGLKAGGSITYGY